MKQGRKMGRSGKQIRLSVGALALVLLFAWYTVTKPSFSNDATVQYLLDRILSRALGSAVFLLVWCSLGYRLFCRMPRAGLLAVLPALAVVINNYPILSAIGGSAYLTRADLIPLFALDALMIGLFEELAFRGVLFPVALEKRHQTTGQIVRTTVASSAVFGLVHLVNLAEGAGIGSTLLQVGYSFLIGGMCAIVLLKCGNLLPCILLHAIYDFCGGLYPTLGAGAWWDTPTVIVTAVLGVAVLVWMLWLLFHIQPEEADRLYKKEKRHEHDPI